MVLKNFFSRKFPKVCVSFFTNLSLSQFAEFFLMDIFYHLMALGESFNQILTEINTQLT